MMEGLKAMMFVVMSVVIAFLVFQVHQDGKRHIETKRIHQKQMEQIARLTIQSSTTVHVYLACENALEAKIKLEDIIETYGRSEERRVGKECRSRWSP